MLNSLIDIMQASCYIKNTVAAVHMAGSCRNTKGMVDDSCRRRYFNCWLTTHPVY